MKLYVLFDSKTETYTPPHAYQARGHAIRSFADGVNETGNNQNMLAKYPEDFTLFEVAEYDPKTGLIKPHETKISVVNGNDVKTHNQVAA